MADTHIVMLAQNYGVDTVVGELARELLATRLIARTACRLKNPLLTDAEVAEVVSASVDLMRQGTEFDLRTRLTQPQGGVN